MYLYTPIDGRSIVIERITISGSGMEFGHLVECLDAEVGKLLKREGKEILVINAPEPEAPKKDIPTIPLS